MGYSPINPNIFNSAYCGCFYGIAANYARATDPNAADYANPALIAGAFAQAVDIAWNNASADLLDINTIQSACTLYWSTRAINSSSPRFTQATDWTTEAEAIVAMVDAAEAYFAAQGISPLPIPSNGNSQSGGRTASTTLLAPFEQPALGGTVTANFATAGLTVGLSVFIPGTGLGNQYVLESVIDGQHGVLLNPPASSYIVNNSPEGTTIAAGTIYAIGPVANRSYCPAQIADNTDGFMCSLTCRVTDDISAIRIAWPGWAAVSGIETPLTGNVTITASVEYPIGETINRLTFNAADAGVIEPGTNLFNDFAFLSTVIPRGALCKIKWYWTGSTQIPYSAVSHLNVAGGDAISTTVGDLTGTTETFADGGNGLTMAPIIILGYTTRNTFALLGDSRIYGLGDTTTDGGNLYGTLPRLIGPTHACVNLAASGELAQGFVSSHALRLPLAQFCNAVVDEHGINDLDQGSSPATVETALTTIYGYFPTVPVFACTLSPVTTSTDDFATITNQTPSSSNANRVTVNTWIRNNVAGVYGTIDIALVTESSYNSGTWAVTGLTGADDGFTVDGLHESSMANRKAANGGLSDAFVAFLSYEY